MSKPHDSNPERSPQLASFGSGGLKRRGWKTLLMMWMVWLCVCLGADLWAQHGLRQAWAQELIYGLDLNAKGSSRRLKTSIDFVEFLALAFAADSGSRRSAGDAKKN